ncbi:MAG: hypothetical protein RL026_2648 [Pseudomonadota bacterium]|jgi:putative protein-disulfide isomerase
MPRLHYFYDPQCGWCYGVAPLIAAAATYPGLQLVLQPGCLWPRPTLLPADVRDQIRRYDAHVARLSGQAYGEAYLQGLLRSDEMLLHSAPTVTAVLAAGEQAAGADLGMLRAQQTGHYVRGLRVADPAVQVTLAEELGLDVPLFRERLKSLDPRPAFARAQSLMRELGVQGFPACFLEQRGRYTAVPPQDWFGNPSGYLGALQGTLSESMH